MLLSQPYLDVTMGIVVPIERRRDFRSMKSIVALGPLRLAIVGEPALGRTIESEAPNVDTSAISNVADYFTHPGSYDGVVMSAAGGSAWTLFHPNHVVVVPEGIDLRLPLVYAMQRGEDRFARAVNQWIEFQKRSRRIERYFDHWILGRGGASEEPRWSIARNVLGWLR